MDKLYIEADMWIDWKIIATKQRNTVDIDQLLKPTLNLWKNLEYHCDAECCE